MSDVVSLLGVQNTMPGAAEFQPPPAPAGRSPRSTVARCVTSRFSLSLSPRSLSCPALSCLVLSCPVLSSPVLSFPVPVVRFRLAYLSAVPEESDGDGSFSRTAERFLATRERDTDRLWDRERENLCACGRGEWGVYVIVKIRGDFTETRL